MLWVMASMNCSTSHVEESQKEVFAALDPEWLNTYCFKTLCKSLLIKSLASTERDSGKDKSPTETFVFVKIDFPVCVGKGAVPTRNICNITPRDQISLDSP